MNPHRAESAKSLIRLLAATLLALMVLASWSAATPKLTFDGCPASNWPNMTCPASNYADFFNVTHAEGPYAGQLVTQNQPLQPGEKGYLNFAVNNTGDAPETLANVYAPIPAQGIPLGVDLNQYRIWPGIEGTVNLFSPPGPTVPNNGQLVFDPGSKTPFHIPFQLTTDGCALSQLQNYPYANPLLFAAGNARSSSFSLFRGYPLYVNNSASPFVNASLQLAFEDGYPAFDGNTLQFSVKATNTGSVPVSVTHIEWYAIYFPISTELISPQAIRILANSTVTYLAPPPVQQLLSPGETRTYAQNLSFDPLYPSLYHPIVFVQYQAADPACSGGNLVKTTSILKLTNTPGLQAYIYDFYPPSYFFPSKSEVQINTSFRIQNYGTQPFDIAHNLTAYAAFLDANGNRVYNESKTFTDGVALAVPNGPGYDGSPNSYALLNWSFTLPFATAVQITTVRLELRPSDTVKANLPSLYSNITSQQRFGRPYAWSARTIAIQIPRLVLTNGSSDFPLVTNHSDDWTFPYPMQIRNSQISGSLTFDVLTNTNPSTTPITATASPAPSVSVPAAKGSALGNVNGLFTIHVPKIPTLTYATTRGYCASTLASVTVRDASDVNFNDTANVRVSVLPDIVMNALQLASSARATPFLFFGSSVVNESNQGNSTTLSAFAAQTPSTGTRFLNDVPFAGNAIQSCVLSYTNSNPANEFYAGNAYQCCTRGFCTANAFNQSFQSFKAYAAAKLAMTAKRRGNDANFQLAPDETGLKSAFTVSTAALVLDDVNSAYLSSLGITPPSTACVSKPSALQLTATYKPAMKTWTYSASFLTFSAANSLARYGNTPALAGTKQLCGLETTAVNEFACDLRPATPFNAFDPATLYVSFGNPA